MKSNWEKNLIIVTIIGLVVGSWGMYQRLIYGHLGMNYGSFVPWGLWVAFDLFFLGLTAGAFLITILIIIGPYWWAFWIVHVLIGSLVPVFLLIRYRRIPRWWPWPAF